MGRRRSFEIMRPQPEERNQDGIHPNPRVFEPLLSKAPSRENMPESFGAFLRGPLG